MKLIVTGGGTGGHVYPALEVAKFARNQGAEVAYFGSLRGQEGKASEASGFPFHGFGAEPLYSFASAKGLRSLTALLRARSQAKASMKKWKADAVFSTGGYSAGPVVSAAKSLHVPYFIHEANSVPGRSNLVFAKRASAFTTLFKSTEKHAPGIICNRVGQPLRQELRDAVSRREPVPDLVLCLGGSQGSEFLNGSVPRAFAGSQLSAVRLLIVSGPKNLETTESIVQRLGVEERVEVRPYLQTHELLHAYCQASLVIGRSGSTLAELAAFGIPSILVPLPTSAGNHQLHNAEEFVEMNAATLLEQADASPSSIADAISGWLVDPQRMEACRRTLNHWDLPAATETIYDRILRSRISN